MWLERLELSGQQSGVHSSFGGSELSYVCIWLPVKRASGPWSSQGVHLERRNKQASGQTNHDRPAVLEELCMFLMLPVSACRWCCERGSGVTDFVLFSVNYFAAGRLLASGNTGSSKRQSLFLAFWAHVFPSPCICVAERCKQVLVTWSDIYCYACASGSILPWRHQSRHLYWPQTHSMSCSSCTHSLWVSFALVIQQDWFFSQN